MRRRDFVKGCFAAGATAASYAVGWRGATAWAQAPPPGGWDALPAILGRIRAPVFESREFPITRFGAVGDNKHDNTDAFSLAIDACHKAGGGRIVVPAGEFQTGAIRLLSNVALHVEAGATVRFVRDAARYPLVLTRFEGVELMNYSPFIYAFDQENVGVTGSGTIDGNAGCEGWWVWKPPAECGAANPAVNQKDDRDALFRLAEQGVAPAKRVFGPGHFLRPQFIQPYRCRNVVIEGVTLLNSPMWQVHPVLCTNVTVQDLHINSAGPNTDGCDPESCTDVLIRRCDFNTGDDCIAIKSGRNADGRRLASPSRNIVIEDCRMRNGHGGVTIGSEISGGVENVFVQNCRMDSPNLDFAVRIKNNAMRGGLIEHVYVRNVTVGQVAKAAVTIDFYYEEADKGNFPPVVRDVDIRGLTTAKSQYALYLRGFANAPIRDVRLTDCTFDGVKDANVLEHVEGLSASNVRINGELMRAGQ